MFKTFFKSKAGIVFMAISSVILIIAVIATILLSTIFYNIVGLVLGRGDPVYAEGIIPMYPAVQSQSKEQATANAHAVNERLCEEGFVLLKNSPGVLPMTGGKVSVFGKNSVNLSYGGSGSGGFETKSNKTLYDSLTEAGFIVNPTLKKFYDDDGKSGDKRKANSSDLDSGGNQMIATAETPQSRYTKAVTDSYASYNNAAIVVITRIGGEGFDLPRYQDKTAGAASPDDHYLQLDKNEIDLLDAVCKANFERVIVVFNIPASFEATFLTSKDYAPFADKINAALWIGFTGSNGIMALGKVLNGDVNPSGRLTDTWAADFKKDPTFVNFGTGPNPNTSDKYDAGMYYFVDYEESVYVGYRYYETRGFTDGEDWYKQNVVYPFGYGLSYTTFQSVITDKPISPVPFAKEDDIEINVTVTNTGKVTGKETVQLYAVLPYTPDGIAKPYKVLVGFAKTDPIEPGDSDDVTITVDPYDMASYDYRDANKNKFSGYELEKGTYKLCLSKNAHDVIDSVDYILVGDERFETDTITGEYTVKNRYTGRDGVTDTDAQLTELLSRDDWEGSFPKSPTAAERASTAQIIKEIKDLSHNNPIDFDSIDYPDFDMPVTVTLRDLLPETTPEPTPDPIVDYNDPRWAEILSACSASDLINLYNFGAYSTQAVLNIGMPSTLEGDGPGGFTCFMNKSDFYGTCNYCSEPVMAATFNVELMTEMGEALGEEGVWGNAKTGKPYSGIYAPGVNIHRSPFGGRNSEYFSEDPLLSGLMAAAEIRGAQSRGVYCAVKHFACNEQETHRSINGDCSWLTEQALREIYLKPFEIAVKKGGTRAIMSSFNRIGTRWTGGDYRLLTEILRNEWGFKGHVICDFNTIPQYMNSRQMAYAGGDLNLVAFDPKEWCDPSETGDAVILMQAAKNLMYTVVNSNAMNGEIIDYKLPMWTVIMIVIDAAVLAGIALWFVLVFLKVRKRYKASEIADIDAHNADDSAGADVSTDATQDTQDTVTD